MNGDRAFLALSVVAAAGSSIGAALLIGPHVPPDPLQTVLGRSTQIAALAFGTLGAMSGWLQVHRMYRTQSAHDVSRSFLAMLACSFVAWLGYGIAVGDPVLQAVNVLGFTVGATTLAYAQRLNRRARASSFTSSP